MLKNLRIKIDQIQKTLHLDVFKKTLLTYNVSKVEFFMLINSPVDKLFVNESSKNEKVDYVYQLAHFIKECDKTNEWSVIQNRLVYTANSLMDIRNIDKYVLIKIRDKMKDVFNNIGVPLTFSNSFNKS